jgi:hypothetical protein
LLPNSLSTNQRRRTSSSTIRMMTSIPPPMYMRFTSCPQTVRSKRQQAGYSDKGLVALGLQ